MEKITLIDVNGSEICVKSAEELNPSEKSSKCSPRIFCSEHCQFCRDTEVEENEADPMGRIRIRTFCHLGCFDTAFPIGILGDYKLVRNYNCLRFDPEPEKISQEDWKHRDFVYYKNNYALKYAKHWAY